MIVELNGVRCEVQAGLTLADVVRLVGRDPEGRGVAVALEGEVVPRGQWSSTELPAAARVEVVSAVGGG
jgi:sulfur carrier protein